MKTTSLSEVKEYVKKLYEKIPSEIPKDKSLTPYKRKHVSISRTKQKMLLDMILEKIELVENQ